VWAEIDAAGRVWTVPAERMKMKRDHRGSLCRRALEILDAARALVNPKQEPAVPCGRSSRPASRLW